MHRIIDMMSVTITLVHHPKQHRAMGLKIVEVGTALNAPFIYIASTHVKLESSTRSKYNANDSIGSNYNYD